MSTSVYDIIVIGSGPGGYVAAIRAAQLGLKTAVVEREHLGGICLNWGCIPTKALLRSADVYRNIKEAQAFGLKVDGKIGFDAADLVGRSRGVSGQLNAGVGFLLKKNKVDVIWGEARLAGAGKVEVTSPRKPPVSPQPKPPKTSLGPGVHGARNVIVATGARPRVLPGLEPDGRLIWTYFEAMKPSAMPKSLLIVGSGAIGIEFASFYAAFGVAVTVVEIEPQILPVEDREIAEIARRQFEKQKIAIHTGARVERLEKFENHVIATLSGGDAPERLEAERVIVAAGVVANVEGLGLEEAGIQMTKGFIQTDGTGRTSVNGIYAIGDVAGPPLLAHKAEHEAVACVEAIKGLEPHPIDRRRIPGCTYSHPQIASLGLTEDAAICQGHSIKVGRFPFRANGKAIALGEADGLVKTIFDEQTGELLGAHMVGTEVTELIQGFAIAMQLETTEVDLMRTIFPHPTLSEMMHESTLDAFGRVIHS